MRFLSITVIAATLAFSGCGEVSRDTSSTVDEALSEENPTLDLSRDMLDEPGSADLEDPDQVLPDLFEDQGEEGRVRVSGKVLTKEEAESLQSSVDGAEVRLELKTN